MKRKSTDETTTTDPPMVKRPRTTTPDPDLWFDVLVADVRSVIRNLLPFGARRALQETCRQALEEDAPNRPARHPFYEFHHGVSCVPTPLWHRIAAGLAHTPIYYALPSHFDVFPIGYASTIYRSCDRHQSILPTIRWLRFEEFGSGASHFLSLQIHCCGRPRIHWLLYCMELDHEGRRMGHGPFRFFHHGVMLAVSAYVATILEAPSTRTLGPLFDRYFAGESRQHLLCSKRKYL